MSRPDHGAAPRTRSVTDPADSVTQTRRGSTFDASDVPYDYQQNPRPGPALPPIRQESAVSHGASRNLPPLRLPPLQQLQCSSEQQCSRAMKIETLLTSPSLHAPRVPTTDEYHKTTTDAYMNGRSNHVANTRSLSRIHMPNAQNQRVMPVPGPSSEFRLCSPRTSQEASQSSPTMHSPLSPSTASVSSSMGARETPACFSPHTSGGGTRVPPRYHYKLIVRQQPAAARACGYGERDRRVVDPPPIVELKITDPATGAPVQDQDAILALNCTLMDANGVAEITSVPHEDPKNRVSPPMMGSSVVSNSDYKDERGVAGTFFVFADLSCRFPGTYRLRFKLLRIDPTNTEPGRHSIPPAYVTTDIFRVYIAKDFPGMQPSSALLKALKAQGLQVGIKKGSEERKKKAKARTATAAHQAAPPESDEEEYSDSDSDEDLGQPVAWKQAAGSPSNHKKRRMRT